MPLPMPMPRCSYRSQLDSSKFDTPEKSIAQILSLKHQHVNAARRAGNKQAATSFSTQTTQTENQHTPATTDNGDNVQRATCNTQLQHAAAAAATVAINGRQSNGEAAAPLGQDKINRCRCQSVSPALFLAFPSNVANRFWVIFQNCICMQRRDAKKTLLLLLLLLPLPQPLLLL